MERQALALRYFDAWNHKDIDTLLSVLHPQASYYDAFWQETCAGRDLAKYLAASLELDTRTYELDGDAVPTPNGFILRYLAYDSDAHEGSAPLYNGAEILTLHEDRIITISDYYCDPDPAELLDVASIAQQQHDRAQTADQGLSAKMIRHIANRLSELGETTAIFLNPELTVTQLAEAVGCNAMQLFYVIEMEFGTRFTRYVNEQRVRHATTLLADQGGDEVDVRKIARQVGFDATDEFHNVFASTFGLSASQYAKQFHD